MGERVTIYLDDETAEIARHTDKNADTDSFSETVRELLKVGIEEADESLVPERERILSQYEETKRDNRLRDLQAVSALLGRIEDMMWKRLTNGVHPDDMQRGPYQGYRETAQVLYQNDDPDDDRLERALDGMDRLMERYREEYHERGYDPVEHAFSSAKTTGVPAAADGGEQVLADDPDDELVEAAAARLDGRMYPDPDAIATALAKEQDVDEETAAKAVEAAQQDGGKA